MSQQEGSGFDSAFKWCCSHSTRVAVWVLYIAPSGEGGNQGLSSVDWLFLRNPVTSLWTVNRTVDGVNKWFNPRMLPADIKHDVTNNNQPKIAWWVWQLGC